MKFDPYRNMMLSAIQCAIKDYRSSWRYDAGEYNRTPVGLFGGHGPRTGSRVRDEIREFFRDDPYLDIAITGLCTPGDLLKLCDKEDERYGNL